MISFSWWFVFELRWHGDFDLVLNDCFTGWPFFSVALPFMICFKAGESVIDALGKSLSPFLARVRQAVSGKESLLLDQEALLMSYGSASSA